MTDLTARPANEVAWEDVQAVFGDRGEPARCQCQWYKLTGDGNWTMPREEKTHRFREQLDCGYPDAEHTAGLVGFLDESIAWVAVEPRSHYARLRGMPIPWKGRDENRDDETVWAVTCFVIRKGHRRQGHSRTMLGHAVDHARRRGARAVEGYPMITEPGKDITWGELHVGAYKTFLAAGFREVTHPTKRRYVVRLEL